MKDKIPQFEEYQREKKFEYLLKSFTPEEYIRMLCIPLILTKATFRYLENTLQYCKIIIRILNLVKKENILKILLLKIDNK